MLNLIEKTSLLNALKTYYTSLSVLNNLYENHPELNNLQPDSFQFALPASIDEAMHAVQLAHEEYSEKLNVEVTHPANWDLLLVDSRTPSITTIDEENIHLEDELQLED